MHLAPNLLLLIAAAGVAFIHSLLPDHWVPLAVVARTHSWGLARLARVAALAAVGHVVTSIALGGVIALIGLQFQRQLEAQQGHIVGGVLVIAGAGLLIWNLVGHQHEHKPGIAVGATGSHVHEHSHSALRHSHRHDHEAFIHARANQIAERSEGSLISRLASIAAPFGAAASPDLTFLPIAVAASAYGGAAVASVLGVYAAVTLVTFVGLTVVATAVGYQMRGEWLEDNANTITSLVLIAIGVVVFVGF